MTLIFKPEENEEYENEKLKLGKFVFISTLLVQIANNIFTELLVYDVIVSVGIAISSYIFYKIFANVIIVINEFGIKKVYAIEEVIGASILLAICASSFRELSIYGFEIRTILSILIVMILGWKNGILVGATAGITIGTILGLTNNIEPMQIASYALSGMIAGIFSKLGKTGVIVGFILGNAVIQYVANGNTGNLLYIKEILIASLGLLLVPSNITIDIEDLIGKSRLLPEGANRTIEEAKETIYRLNNVSETIQELADTYKEAAATVVEKDEKEEEMNLKIFIEELLLNLDGLEDNILYEDLENLEKRNLAEDIFKILLQDGTITRSELLKVFENHNNYIIGFDDVQVSLKLETDIQKALEVINSSYKISKVNFIWKQKMEESKKNLKTQLDGVSKVISSLAENLEEKIEDNKYTFIKEREEIIKIAKERKIDLQDVSIKREKTGRYIITVYVNTCTDINPKNGCSIEQMEKILSKVLNEKIVIRKKYMWI